MFFLQRQFGKSTDVFISRDVAYNILEMTPGSLRGIFSPYVIIACHPVNAVPHTPSFLSTSRILYQLP